MGTWSIQVSDWAEFIPRSGYPFLLEAELHPAPDGGTTLQGKVSPTFNAGVTGKVRDKSRARLLQTVAGVIDATIESPASAGSP